MRHLRTDYNAIQAWPTKRPHHGIVTEDSPGGETRTKYLDLSDDSIEQLGDSIEPIIPEDEPVFLLRAKDALAPDLVRSWAQQLRNNMTRELHEGSRSEMSDLADRVMDWAYEMEEYAAEHYDGGYIPDTPAEFLED